MQLSFLSVAMATMPMVPGSTQAPSLPFPVLFDTATTLADPASSLAPITGNLDIRFGSIFECPHPCGLLPTITANGSAVNGGVPQSSDFSLTLHLDTLNHTFAQNVPQNDTRWIDLDFESWNPVWDRNSATYQNYSIDLVKKANPSLNDTAAASLAKVKFEAASLQLLVTTVKYVKLIRPGLKIGMYSFPSRFYWSGYNTTAGPTLRAQNDQLYELWCNLDGLFPSVYQFYNGSKSAGIRSNNVQYVYSNVAEAVRISSNVPHQCSGKAELPVWVYTWHRYHDAPNPFLSDVDEAMYWEQSYKAGASGIVMWGYEPKQNDTDAFTTWWNTDFARLASSWQPSKI